MFYNKMTDCAGQGAGCACFHREMCRLAWREGGAQEDIALQYYFLCWGYV